MYTYKENLILNETTNYCLDCGIRENCAEDACVLRRIEKIITGEN